MARLAGVDLPRDKRVEVALTYIYGIGKTRSTQMLAASGVNPNTRVKDLDEPSLNKLREYIDQNFKIEGDLRREVSADIRRKVEIGSYKVFVIVVDFQFADKEHTPTLELVKVRAKLLPAKRLQ